MKLACIHCEQEIEFDKELAGRTIRCPSCNGELLIPEPSPDDEAPSPAIATLKQTLQASVERGEMTIPQFMEKQRIEGVVDLQGRDDSSSVREILNAEQGRKYRLGQIVASGGMGAILDAKDVNVRRNVAMKVLLDPKKASREQILRFIQEAQITGQLEHPSIVPLHELGVDADGNVFYTMKFVQGATLKDIIEKIKRGSKKAIEEYPLARLLNIFQRICDAIAFAHSKGVIHRDLKPANVMVGEYGEVLVMDWGLAKVMPKRERTEIVDEDRQPTEKKTEIQEVVDSVRKDADFEMLKTMDGMIMGTPGFMAPEQALGETENLDERTDIYALGAMLYNILTLNPPVAGKDKKKVLEKATTGDIPHPSEFNPTGTRGSVEKRRLGDLVVVPLYHCPGFRIPDSLSAVVMKALSLQQAQRYENVKILQTDIEKYQSGFATSAENAGFWRQLGLLFKRHKAMTVTLAVASMVLGGLSMFALSQMRAAKEESNRADQQRQRADKTDQTLGELEGSLETFLALTEKAIKEKEFEEALKNINHAISLSPTEAKYHHLRGNILQSLLRFREGAAAYGTALEFDPDIPFAEESRDLCRKIVKDNEGRERLMPSSLAELQEAMRKQGRNAEVVAISVSLAQEREVLEQPLKAMLDSAGIGYKLTVGKEKMQLDVSSKDVKDDDLSVLKGVPLTELNLRYCRHISDLTPLKGMPLIWLNLDGCREVRDISPLKGMPLTFLQIKGAQVEDLTPLKGMPLTELILDHCEGVSDLTPLKGMPLTSLKLNGTHFEDLTPLKGLPLTSLQLDGCERVSDLTPLKGLLLTSLRITWCERVSDLTPLKGMPLTYLNLDGCENVSDLTPLKGMPLTSLNLHGCERVSDLSPLKGLPLTDLNVYRTQIIDLSPLRDMPLTSLSLNDCSQVSDFSPLRGMPLTSLNLCDTQISDLTPLKGMPLAELQIHRSDVRCLSPLDGMKLEHLLFTPSNVTNGLEIIRNMESIRKIGPGGFHQMPPDEFWRRYDAGEFNKDQEEGGNQ